jgi:hypothetical protein
MEMADLNAGKSTKAVQRAFFAHQIGTRLSMGLYRVNRFGAGLTNRQIAARGFSRVLII